MKEALKRWVNNLTAQQVAISFLTLSLILAVIGYVVQHPEGFTFAGLLQDFYANISSELASIALTVLIIDGLNRRREAAQQAHQVREELIRKLGSKVNEVARQAAEELRAKGWLLDGDLQEADLRAANLEDADLYAADLQGANLQWAMLKNASLKKSSLVGANLSQIKAWGAKCYKADMRSVDFSNAQLYRVDFNQTDLRHANFTGAVLIGANLLEADLRGANFDGAKFASPHGNGEKVDKPVVLPDGTVWTPDCDLARFTDPSHEAHWFPHSTEDAPRIDLGDE